MSGRMLTQLNHTFLTLVPNTSAARSLNDFRPIFCCNVLHKIIAKALANRMQQIIDELVSHNQNAFLKGKLTSDATLLANELVRDFSCPMGSRLSLKVDLKKDFDTVNRVCLLS